MDNDKLLAVYKREDTYSGHSRINHYHIPCVLQCWVVENSWYRDNKVLVNGEPVLDVYQIVAMNYKGERVASYKFTDRTEANKCVAALLSHNKNWKRLS